MVLAERELDARRPLIDLYEAYFEGRHKLNFASDKYRDEYAMMAAVADNWCPLVVKALTERLRIQGFRVGTGGAAGEQRADDEAVRIWQENSLDLYAPMAFTESGKHGESYFLVWWDDTPVKGIFGRFFRRRSRDGRARITVEHPAQMVVIREPGDLLRRRAAFKKWVEDDGTLMASLWLPDKVYRFKRADAPGAQWEPRDDVQESPNRLGIVPVVPLVTEPGMLPSYPPTALMMAPHNVPKVAVGLGRSDLADVISTQDQINKLISDMLVAAEYGAFRQRWASGIQVEFDENGKPKPPFESGPGNLWGTPGKDAKFGEFNETQLENFIKAVDSRVRSVSARSRIPPHYFSGKVESVAAETLKMAEVGLESKATDRQGPFGNGCIEAVQIAFAIEGIKDRDAPPETVWAPSEARSESQYVDSLVKKLALGVPVQQLWEDAGYSPTQIRRFRQMLREQALEAGLFDVTDPSNDGIPPDPEPGAGQ